MKTIFRTAAAALVGLTLSTGANAAGGDGPPLLEKPFSGASRSTKRFARPATACV